MISAIAIEFPPALQIGLPVAIAALALMLWSQHRRGLSNRQLAAVGALRAVALLALIFLAARPVWIAREPPASASRPVVLLVDRSESMALEERDASRYQEAVGFIRERLLPALKSEGFPVQGMLFAEGAEAAAGEKLVSAEPDGKRTNLGGAIASALASSGQPPLAVIALTDGMATESADNNRALAALVDAGVPFIGLGFGSDQGVRTLSLRQVEAPPVVTPRTAFYVSAQLEMMNSEEMPPFDLLFFRDGELREKKTVSPGTGARTWLESFRVSEEEQGAHKYTVQVLPPAASNVKCINMLASTAVRISDEKELRVLYVQGALTWDYKFIHLALKNDPAIRLTGLTRTSKQSVFRQNVETAGELLHGFPTTLEEVAPFRVIVLSNLRAADLTPAQQEILARFCGEMGGGVLLIGGAGTFDRSWQNSRLEQLLPVVFAGSGGVQGLDRPFRLQLSEEALQHPVFQVADNRSTRDIWAQLPAFTHYGRVDAPKPGAQVWAVHESDDGPRGRRVLMASQRYGAGLSAVLCLQNFWRWRLAKDSNPQEFDRFWRQLFRYLGEIGRQDVSIHLVDQDLRPETDVQLVLEKQPNPKNVTDTAGKFRVRVEDGEKKVLADELVELRAARPVDVTFRAGRAGMYQVTVRDALEAPVATRAIEIRDVNVELQNTARNMEVLRQWALVSDGLAMKIEDCSDAGELVAQIQSRIERVRQGKQVRRPAGVNGWMLALILGCLGTDWVLRKRWGLA
jgi:hypothetical protein